MKTKKNKDINLQIRVTADQDEFITLALAQYILTNEESITKSEFVRRMLLLQCLKLLRIVEVK